MSFNQTSEAIDPSLSTLKARRPRLITEAARWPHHGKTSQATEDFRYGPGGQQDRCSVRSHWHSDGVAPGYTLTASIGLIVYAVGLKMPAIYRGFHPDGALTAYAAIVN